MRKTMYFHKANGNRENWLDKNYSIVFFFYILQ